MRCPYCYSRPSDAIECRVCSRTPQSRDSGPQKVHGRALQPCACALLKVRCQNLLALKRTPCTRPDQSTAECTPPMCAEVSCIMAQLASPHADAQASDARTRHRAANRPCIAMTTPSHLQASKSLSRHALWIAALRLNLRTNRTCSSKCTNIISTEA